MRPTAEEIIASRQLQPLPQEGGYFRRCFTAPQKDAQGRAASSAIDFLITDASFSALHRIDAEETFTLLDGDPAEMLQFDPVKDLCTRHLFHGDQPGHRTVRVPPHIWQGLRLSPGGTWALFHVQVVPEFSWATFELANPQDFLATYSRHALAFRNFLR